MSRAWEELKAATRRLEHGDGRHQNGALELARILRAVSDEFGSATGATESDGDLAAFLMVAAEIALDVDNFIGELLQAASEIVDTEAAQ